METQERLQYAIGKHQAQNFFEAEAAFRQILDEEDTDPTVYLYLADCQMRLNKPAQALATAEQGVKAHPTSLDTHGALSQLYWTNGRQAEAVQCYERMVEIKPDDVNVQVGLANMYYSAGRKDEAIKTFQAILEVAPNMHQIHTNIGVILLRDNNYQDAIVHFEEALKIEPGQGPVHKQLGMAYHISGDLDKAESHLGKALERSIDQADKIELLVLNGNVKRDQNKTDEAIDLYEQVLKLDPENEIAKQNVQGLTKSKIDLWHFTMLADVARNEAYDKAITSAVSEGDTVLDIGAGSGLLSMMAARAGAKQVTAVEMVSDMASVAKQIVKDNDYSEVITIHQKKSTALKVGEDMPEKAAIVVHEILDAGLLGEGVLPSLRHAWDNLLKPDAISVPKGADVYAMLLQSDHFHSVSPVGEIQGFDLSAFNHFYVPHENFARQLSELPHEKLSAVFPVMSVDFHNLPPSAPAQNPNKMQLSVDIENDGKLHGVAFWFDLNLNDEIKMSSGPGGELIHWGQAIYMLGKEYEVKAGDTISLTVLQSDMAISFRVNE